MLVNNILFVLIKCVGRAQEFNRHQQYIELIPKSPHPPTPKNSDNNLYVAERLHIK